MTPDNPEVTMVERAAEALWLKGPLEWEGDGVTPLAWAEVHRFFKEDYREQVRAVIEAVREPTETMIDAGGNALADHQEFSVYAAAKAAWQAMISAALSEGVKGGGE